MRARVYAVLSVGCERDAQSHLWIEFLAKLLGYNPLREACGVGVRCVTRGSLPCVAAGIGRQESRHPV